MNPDEPDLSQGDFHCIVCDTHINSELTWSSHIVGRRHIKNVAKVIPESRHVEIDFDKRRKKLTAALKHVKGPTVGLSHMCETLRRLSSFFNCFLCSTVLSTHMAVVEHVSSLDHKLNYLKSSDPEKHKSITEIQLSKEYLTNLVDEACCELENNLGQGEIEVKVDEKEKEKEKNYYYRDRPEYKPDPPDYYRDRPEYKPDPPDYYRDRPEYKPDPPDYYRDRPEYKPDPPDYYRDRPEYKPDPPDLRIKLEEKKQSIIPPQYKQVIKNQIRQGDRRRKEGGRSSPDEVPPHYVEAMKKRLKRLRHKRNQILKGRRARSERGKHWEQHDERRGRSTHHERDGRRMHHGETDRRRTRERRTTKDRRLRRIRSSSSPEDRIIRTAEHRGLRRIRSSSSSEDGIIRIAEHRGLRRIRSSSSSSSPEDRIIRTAEHRGLRRIRSSSSSEDRIVRTPEERAPAKRRKYESEVGTTQPPNATTPRIMYIKKSLSRNLQKIPSKVFMDLVMEKLNTMKKEELDVKLLREVKSRCKKLYDKKMKEIRAIDVLLNNS